MEQSHPFDGFSSENPKNPESEAPAFDDPRRERIMGMLRDSILRNLTVSNRSRPIGQNLKSHIEKQLHGIFPSRGTPSHPPYALMIQTAIMEMNEERGSSEESISGFITKNYEGLPWGHATFLSHHLRKLCQTGEIACKNDGQYMIAVNQGRVEEEIQVKGHEVDVINERNKVRNKQVAVVEKWRRAEKWAAEERNNAWRQDTRAEEQIERPSVQLYENGPECQLVEVNDQSSCLQELQFEVSDKHALACVQQNMVIVEQNIPEELRVEGIHEKRNDDEIIACDGLSTSVEKPCMELVKKKAEFQEQLIVKSHFLEGMEWRKYDNPKPMMEEEKKDDLESEWQQVARSPCMERASVVKVIEGEMQLEGQEDRFIWEESLQPHQTSTPMTEEKKDDLEVEQQQTRSPCTERGPYVTVIEEEKQLQEQNDKFIRKESRPQEHHIECETNVLRFCCINGESHSENLRVSLGDSSLPVLKRQRKKFLKQQQQQQQQRRSIWGEKKIVIICGLQAQRLPEQKIYSQQKAPKSFLGNKQQQPSHGMTMAVSLPSDWQHDIEQHHKQQREVRGGVRPSTRDADAFLNDSLRIYVRRKCRA